MILMDIDGTLVSSSRTVLEETKRTLLRAQSMGITLALASGRPTSGLLALGKELLMHENHGLFISYNGSRVTDCETMQILFNQPLSVEEGKAVLQHMKQFEVYPMIDKGTHMYVNDVYPAPITHHKGQVNIVEVEARAGGYLLCEQSDLVEFLDYEVNKILTAGEPSYLQAHYQEMMEPFADRLNCMFTAPWYFEFTAKGVDKAKAIDSVVRPMGIAPEEMIAFGDGMNDLSMITYAGTGVAMENAVQPLKDAAQYITASNDEDGIAKALKHFIPELAE